MVGDGRKVLVVDIDPQSNTSSGIGASKNIRTHTIYDLLVQQDDELTIFDVIVPTQRRELVVAPCTVDLAAAEVGLVGTLARESRLHHVLEPIRQRSEYLLMHGSPSLGRRPVNALVARRAVYIPA